jgi:hypothetical protein
MLLIRYWIAAPEWSERVEGDYIAELHRMLDLLAPVYQQRMMRHLNAWQEPVKDIGEEIAPQSASRIADALRVRLTLGKRRTLGEIDQHLSLGIIVLDPCMPRSGQRARLASICKELFAELETIRTDSVDDFRLAVFRIGQSEPVALSGEKPSLDVLAPEDMPSRPRLLAPVFEKLPTDRVKFVVLLTTRGFIDLEDWADDWRERGILYLDVDRQPDHLPQWSRVDHVRDKKQAARKIAKRIERLQPRVESYD